MPSNKGQKSSAQRLIVRVKVPKKRSLHKAIIMLSNMDALETLYLGTLDPLGYRFISPTAGAPTPPQPPLFQRVQDVWDRRAVGGTTFRGSLSTPLPAEPRRPLGVGARPALWSAIQTMGPRMGFNLFRIPITPI